MAKSFIVLLLLLFSNQTLAHWLDADCNDGAYDYIEHFKLGINLSFHDEKIYFIFCDAKTKDTSSYLLLVIDGKNGHDNKHFSIPLDEEATVVLKEKFESAWDYNRKDAASGMDGSYWCLEVRRQSTYTKGCFFSPIANARERGLLGLSNLGKYLWKKADLERQYGALF